METAPRPIVGSLGYSISSPDIAPRAQEHQPATFTLHLATCVTFLTLLVGLAIYLRCSVSQIDSLDDATSPILAELEPANPCFVQAAHCVDTHGTRWAHRGVLLALGAGLLVIVYSRESLEAAYRLIKGQLVGDLLVMVSAAAFVIVVYLGYRESWTHYCYGVAALIGCSRFGSRLTAGPWRYGWLLASIAFLIALTLPGFFDNIDLTQHNWVTIEIVEPHYGYLLSQGDRLANGHPLGDMVTPYYGLLMPLLVAIAHQAGIELTLHGYIVLIRALQGVALVMSLLCYHVFARRQGMFALFALLFLGSTFHFNYWPILVAPNHTAWREIGFPFAFLGLIACRRLPETQRSLAAGVLAGFAILLNIETGVAITAGLGMFLVLCATSEHPSCWEIATGKAAILAAVGSITVMATFCGIFYIALGYFPGIAWVFDMIRTLKFFSCTLGEISRFDPFSLWIFIHCLITIISAWIDAKRAFNFYRAYRAAAATTLAVWFSYYVNRTDPAYLASVYMLYGVLIIDLLQTVCCLKVSLDYRKCAIAAGAFALLVVPRLVTIVEQQWPAYRKGLQSIGNPPPQDRAIPISGVHFALSNRSIGLMEKAAYLRQQTLGTSPIYLTVDSYLMAKVSGVWSSIPCCDVLWESPTKRNVDKLVQHIIKSRSQVIYFDAPETIECDPAHEPPIYANAVRQFHRDLREMVSPVYCYSHTSNGWEHWTRRVPQTVSESITRGNPQR